MHFDVLVKQGFPQTCATKHFHSHRFSWNIHSNGFESRKFTRSYAKCYGHKIVYVIYEEKFVENSRWREMLVAHCVDAKR